MCYPDSAVSSEPFYDFGTYTFEREMTLDGAEVTFYESGDEYFSYAHDENGYILIADRVRGTLTYAVSSDGVPVSSGVSAAASAEEIGAVAKMTYLDLSAEYVNAVIDAEAVYAGGSGVAARIAANSSDTPVTITNLVIFIAFAGESYTPGSDIDTMLNGAGSVRSYYEIQSGGGIFIDSLMPETAGGAYFVYTDSSSRNSYNVSGSSVSRQNKERDLLTRAVAAAKDRFDLSGVDLDVDGDGYIDSVSFIVCGSSSSTWGSLLWPHSWNLDDIDGAGYSEINGVKVGDYSFNFDTSLNVGVLAHETGHVLGAPDLYHYNKDFVPVGEWDLMATNHDTPQYMLTYTRDKYLGGIADGEIKDITSNGTFSLSPVSASYHQGGTLAYRIYTDTDEYFMVEYRRSTFSGFDSELPGSGLIIYRIKEPDDFSSSTGNMNAAYQGSGSLADEVYVFRPDLADVYPNYTRYYRSSLEAGYAYMSPSNPYFQSIGSLTSTAKYDPNCLYFSNGTNSGIVISVNSISSESVEFTVRMANSERISDQYFNDKIYLSSAALVNVAEYAGLGVTVTLGEFETRYLSALTVEALSAAGDVIAEAALNYGRFLSSYSSGTRVLDAKFVVSAKGNTVTSLFDNALFSGETEPVSVRLTVTDSDGDEIVLGTSPVDNTAVTWETVLNTVMDKAPSISASYGITAAVSAFGIVDVSGRDTDFRRGAEGYAGAVAVAAARTHTLVLNEALRVIEFGSSAYGEQNVYDWENVVAVAAGYHTSYGLLADGRVLATGLNDAGQLDVASWSSITSISAGLKHVVGVSASGTVVAAGRSSAFSGIESVSDAVYAAAGDDFTAVLSEDGTVGVYGAAAGIDTSSWSGIVAVSAGARHVLGLKEDGTVVASGDNSYDQCNVGDLKDIEAVAAGDSHSAFIREDGTVIFRGAGGEEYATEGIGNLKFTNYVYVENISVSYPADFRLAVGDEFTVSVGVAPANPTYTRMIFTSSDPDVLSVSATGYTEAVISAVSDGYATLTVTALGAEGALSRSAEIEVYTKIPLDGISFTSPSVSVLEGAEAVLELVLSPDGAEPEGVPEFVSADPSVASVNYYTGAVTAIKAGTTEITATLDGFTAKVTVTVVDSSGVTLSVSRSGEAPYKYGEPLKYSEYTVRAEIFGSEDIQTVTLMPGMVTGYDPYSLGTQTVNVSYMGADTSFTVEVKDYIVSISHGDLSGMKREYMWGEALSGTTPHGFAIRYASGAESSSTFMIHELQGYDMYKLGTQTLTYSYEDPEWGTALAFGVDIVVHDYTTGISFVPMKAQYMYGESLYPGELVALQMASGMTRYVDISETEVADTASAATDKSDPLYSLYSVRTGEHVLELSYYDAVSGTTVSTAAKVDVIIGGEYYFSGADEAGRFLYPVGGDLNIEITMRQYNVSVTLERAATADDIPLDGGGLYYVVSGFNSSAAGMSEVTTVELYSVGQQATSSGEIDVFAELIGSWGITVYGYAAAAEITLITDKTEYLFGETVNAFFEIMFEGETVTVPPMETYYDPTATGTVEFGARYMDDWYYTNIAVNDYCMYLMPIPDVSVGYGDAFAPGVRAVMAAEGVKTLEPGEYSVEGDISTRVPGTRTITVSYGGTSVSFELTVTNAVVSVEVVTPPRTAYIVGETFDPSSVYMFTYASGDTATVSYNADDFTVEPGLDSLTFTYINESGVGVYIYYTAGGVRLQVWSGRAYAPDYVTLLTVVVTEGIVTVGNEPDIEAYAYYASGTSRRLGRNEYSLEFDAHTTGEQQAALVYTYRGITYREYFTVTVRDEASSITLVSLPSTRNYGYGAVISWAGAVVRVEYRAAGTATYSGNEIPLNLNVSYSTLTSGSSEVTLASGSASASFRITVGSAENALSVASSDVVSIDLAARRIVVNAPATADDARSAVVSMQNYLSAKYVAADGSEVTDYTLGAVTGDRYIIFNSAGVEVFVFKIYVNGDTDGDGKVTQNDIDEMARILAGKEADVWFDFNGDLKCNLTDLVMFQRALASPGTKTEGVS